MPEITSIPNTVDIASVRTDSNKYLYLPATSSIYGKTITVKDITGGASNHPITLYTQGPDTFEDGTSSNIIDISFGYTSFFAKSNIWYLINNKANTGEADANYGTVTRDVGIQSLSSIISYGLSSIYAPFDNIPLSSIFSYGLSTIYSPYGLSSLSSITSYSISSFSSIIGLSFITSSTFTTYISSPFAEFSSISTQTLIIGNLEYPLNIDIGLNTPSIRIDEIEADISYIKLNVGIGREATDEYILDITPDNYARFKSIEVESIRADRLIGNASLITNVSKQDGGLSSLSSIISYGLSSIITPQLTDSIKTLSTIVSYGLSTVTLNLQLDSNITSFHASNIGGTGILGTNIQSNNDTYTSAIGKIDSWLYTNIVGNPPAPTFYEKTISGNENEGFTFIGWNAPNQTKIGFGDNLKYIPYILSLSIELSNIYVGTFCNITLGSNYIPLIGSNIEGILCRLYTTRDLPEFSISNLGGKNILNLPILLTPRDGGGLPPKTYNTDTTVPIISTPSDFIDDTNNNIILTQINIPTTNENTTIKIITNEVWLEQPEYIFSARIWYANYSLDPYNILEFNNLTFCNGNIPRLGPDPPQLINIDNISDDSNTIQIISPTYSVKNTQISPSYINFSNYYIEITLGAPPRRYLHNSENIYRKYTISVESNYQSNISQSYTFYDLIPDTTYNIIVAIDNSFYPYENNNLTIPKNSSNLGLSNITITTSLPSAPPSITDVIVKSNIGKYQYSGQAIYDTGNIRYDSIYNTNTMNLQFTTNPLGIHTILNSGSDTEDTISLFAVNINNNNNNNDGISIDSYYYLSSYFLYIEKDIINTLEQNYDNKITISGIVTDFYSNDNIRSNFYQVFTPTISISNLPPSTVPYIFTLFHTNILLGCNLNILSPYSNYYIDDINDTPSIAGWTIEEQNTLYISGVKVTSYSNTLSNNIDIQNLGRYFYVYEQNLLVATYCNYNINISSNNVYNQRTALYTTDNSYQTLPLQNPVRIKSIISINCNTLYTPASNSNGGFTIYTQLCNLVGQSYPSLNSFIYFDAQSENIVKTIINSPNSIGGLRLESQMSGILIMPSSNLINNLPYNNSNNIYTYYNTNTDYTFELPLINGYFRTAANLSNLYDYIHLYCNVSVQNYTKIKNETTKIRYATFKYSFINSSEMIVNQLKLEINNSVGFNSNPDGTYNSSVPYLYYYVETPGIYNSNWINANKIRDSSFPFNTNDRIGMRKDSITSNSRYLFLIPIQPDVPYNVYVRIGLQMNCNINFNYITISPGFNTNPGPSNPTITSFISQSYSLKLNWINTDFDYGGIIDITPNRLFSENRILRRYIPGGVDGIIQESHFKDVIYDDIRGLTTFSNTYSNYDTPYNAILSFTNENGQTSTEQYPLNNPQLFNVGSNYLLYGVVFNKVYYGNSYSNYIQLRSLENIAANIRLYNEKDTYEILKTINTHSGFVNLRVLAGINTPNTDTINYMLNLTRRFTTSNLAGIVIGNNVFSNLNSTYNSNRTTYINAGCNQQFLAEFDNLQITNTASALQTINLYINQLRNSIIADGNWVPPIGIADGPQFFNYYGINNIINNNQIPLKIFLSNIDFFGLNYIDTQEIDIESVSYNFISSYNNIRSSLDNLNILNTNIWITEVGFLNTSQREFFDFIINWYNDSLYRDKLYRDKKIPFYWYSMIATEYDNWGLFTESLNPKWNLFSGQLSIIFDPSNDLYYSSTGEYANWISNYIPPSATSLPPYNAPYFYEVQSYLNISNIGVRSHIHSNIYSIITRKIEPFFLYEYLQNHSIQFDYGNGLSGYGINDLPGKDLSNWSFIASWLNIKPPTNNIFTFSNDLYVYSNSALSITQESNITLNIINISDQYSSGQATGFYMKAYANIIVTSDIYNNDNIDYTKPNIFSISLNNPVPFHVINSSNYYIDNFRNSIPNVVSIDVDNNEIISLPGIYSNYICGVLCFSGLNSNTFYVGISNIGSYAYVSDLFSGEIYGSNLRFNNKLPFYYDQGLQIINNSFSNITYIPVRHSFGRSLYSASNDLIFSNIIVRNVYNSNNSPNILYYGFQNKNLLFDDPSIEIVNREKSNYEYNFAPGFQRNFGQRVESGTTLYPDIGQFGSNFNNTFYILQGQYFNEIQLANGYYRTYCNATLNGASNGYLQYKNFYDPYSRHINYAIIPSEYQYVTYSWHISPTDMNFSNVRLFYTFGGDTIYNGTTFNGIQILFKIVASNETTSLPNNKTTGWLNANALTQILNSNNKSSDGVACSFNITNENISILFPEPYEQYCNVDFKIYIKFGLPSSSNISLEVGNLNINSTLKPFSNDSLTLTLSNNNSLYLGIGASIVPTLGTTYIQFKASNIYGNVTIQPSNYTNLSEIITNVTCNYYINYADCAYNSNTASNNVSLWIYASNIYNNKYYAFESSLDGSTGQQCNFSPPTISNYSNVMNVDGSVTTRFAVDNNVNLNRGTVVWSLEYSNALNNIKCNAGPFSNVFPYSYTNIIVESNFYQYYSNIVTLTVTIQSNCWISASNTSSNLTSNYIPISGKYIGLQIQSNSTRDVGLIVTRSNGIDGRGIKIYFRASNIDTNNDGIIIEPSNYDFRQGNLIIVGSSQYYNIKNTDCSYNNDTSKSNVALWILASNTIRPNETYYASLDGSTGQQCNFIAPTINNYRNVMNVDGSVTTTFDVDNNNNRGRGDIVWNLSYYNASNNIRCNSRSFSNVRPYYYSNSDMIVDSNFYQYYSNTVTLTVTIQSNCWLPESNTSSNLTSNYIPISGKYIGLELQSNNTRDVGLIVTRSNGIDGRDIKIYFWASNKYFNSEGTIIQPTYDYALNNFINVNTSQFYNIENRDCSYNCNTALSNVRLWILASNANRPNETYYASLDGSTGQQCNFIAPTINNYKNVMNVDGSVTTTFDVDNNVNLNRGTVVWRLEYSNALNNIKCNAGPFSNIDCNYTNSDMIVDSNFYQYYSNTVTLTVTIQSNCWISASNTSSNLTSNYIPISGKYIGLELQSNNTRDVGLIVTRSNGIDGRQIKIYFWASNKYFNSEGTIIQPTYDYALNNFINVNTSQFYNIENRDCSYNCNTALSNVRLWILASNANRPNETYSNFVEGNTGAQCNLPVPTISNYSNVMNIDGSVTTYATIHNYIPGTINWSIKYSNIDNGTVCNITPTINNTCNISFCNYPTMKNNTNFYQYYNNIVTLNVNLSNYCWRPNSNSASDLTSNYVRIDSESINVSILNSNSLYLGARVNLTKSITGEAAIFFKASNMYGTPIIIPSNYNYVLFNKYNTINTGSNYFIDFSYCYYNNTPSTSNVTLWILASNTREPFDDKYEVPLLASTGQQCNFQAPTIIDYSNRMTRNGHVTTQFNINNNINDNRGTIVWRLTYSNASNNITCNAGPFSNIDYNYTNSDMNVANNFYQYYSNIVTLEVTVQSNCWSNSPSSNISQLTPAYKLMTSNSFITTLTNNNSLYLGVTTRQKEAITANVYIYFKASNIYGTTTINPSSYIFLSNLDQGESTSCNIEFNYCYYNCNTASNNVALWILASNADPPYEKIYIVSNASTGEQCNFSNPIITNYSNTMDPNGYIITSFNVNNNENNGRGIINWFITYSNAATRRNFESPNFSNNNYTSPFNFTYNNSNNTTPRPNFSDYYNNIVTLNMTVDSNCWRSGFSNIATNTIPYVPIDSSSLRIDIINSNTRDLGAVLTLTKALTGNPNIVTFFWASNRYFNSEGTYISPSNYNSALTSNLSNIVDASNRFTIVNTECSYNSNTSRSNVALWIFASNTNYPNETFCNSVDGSTGPQCNFSNPIITGYTNTMDPPGFPGYVITSFNVDNRINGNRGIIKWFITYSNAATRRNFRSGDFSCNNYTSPFNVTYNNSNNTTLRPNFSNYYSNIVTLNLTVDSNCWRSGFSNIFTTTIPYVPIDSRSLSLVAINNGTRNLGAVLTLTKALTGNPNIVTYFRASNLYFNSERTIIAPCNYNFTSLNILENTIGASTRFTIVNTECSYNSNTSRSNVALWIFASNTNAPNETFSNFVEGSTGEQCNFYIGSNIIRGSNIIDIINASAGITTGTFNLTFIVNNSYCNYQGASNRWRVNLSNTYCNIEFQSDWFTSNFNNCNFSEIKYSTVPRSDQILRYFSNIVTVEVEFSSNCWETYRETRRTRTAVYPQITPILKTNPFNYIFTSNYTTLIEFSNYNTIPGRTNNSLFISTIWTTLANRFSSNTSNYLASNIIPDSNYSISAYYEIKDLYNTNIFRSPVSDEYPFIKYVYTSLQENIINNITRQVYTSNSDRFITLIKADIYDGMGNKCNDFFNTATGDSTKNIYLEYRVRSNNPSSERKYEIGGQDRDVKFGSNLTFNNTRFNVVTMNVSSRLALPSPYNTYYIQSYIYYNICNIVSPGEATIRSFRLNYSNDPTAAYNNTQLELNSEFLVVELSNSTQTACNYRITFQPIQNNIYPRRWVPSVNSNPVFQEARLSNIIIRANRGITTYSNTFSGYDTQYRVIVRTDNEFMVGSNSSNTLDTSIMFPYNSEYLMAGGYTFDALGVNNQYIQAYYYYLNRLQRIMPSARMLGSTDGTPFQGYEFALSLLTRYSSALGNFKLVLDCGYKVNNNGFIDNNALTDNINYLTSIVEMYGTQNIGGIVFGSNIYGKVIKSKPEGNNDINRITLITNNYAILSNQLINLRTNLSRYGRPPPIIYADYNINDIPTFTGSPQHFTARTTFSNFINMVDTFGMEQYGEPSLTTTSNIIVYCNAINTLYNNYRDMLRDNIRIILNEFGDGPIQIQKAAGFEDSTDTGALLARYTVYTAIQQWANRRSPTKKPILQFNYRILSNVYSRHYGTNMFIREQNSTGVVLRLNPNVGRYVYNFPRFYTYYNSDFIVYSSSDGNYPAPNTYGGGFTPTTTPQSTFCNPRRTPLPDYNRPSFEDVNRFRANGDTIDIMPPISLTSDSTGYSVFNGNINNIIFTTNSNAPFYINYRAPALSGYFMGNSPGAGTAYILNTLPGSNLSNVRFTASLIKLNPDITEEYPNNNSYNCSNELYVHSNIIGTNRSNGILYLNNIRDMYSSGGRTGFHMIASPWIQISQNRASDLLRTYSSNTEYVAILRGYQTSNYMNLDSFCKFMIDDTPYVAPSILGITTSNIARTYNICGVLCYSGTDTNSIRVIASNIGDYSYDLNPISATIISAHNNNVITYRFSHNTTRFISRGLDRTYLSNRGFPFPETLFVTIDTINNSNAYGALTVSNIFVKNNHNLESTRCNIIYGYNSQHFFFDTPSITVLNNTSDSNYIPSKDINYGIRVRPPGGTDLNYPDILENYNHSISLRIGGYVNELQLTNGAYRTYCNARFNGASNGYLDYTPYYDANSAITHANYTTLSIEPKKYITLLWHFDVFAIPWYAATFEFSFITAPRYNRINRNFPDLDIYYRIIGPADSNSTNWLNANSNSTRIPKTRSVGDPDGTVGGITGSSNSLTVFFPRVTNNYCNIEFNLYLRIGIPNNSNVAFNYVNLYAFESESLKISLL